jgi:CBS domain-containing protein
MHAMKIGEFLTRSHQRLVMCLPDDTLNAVAKLMYEHNIGAMPVCEIGTRMVGIISERDLVRVFARTDWSELQYLRTRDVMMTRVVSCGPDDDMRSALDLMRVNHFRHLPIVKNERVLGMLSMRDILAVRLQESEAETNVLRDAVVAARYH